MLLWEGKLCANSLDEGRWKLEGGGISIYSEFFTADIAGTQVATDVVAAAAAVDGTAVVASACMA